MMTLMMMMLLICLCVCFSSQSGVVNIYSQKECVNSSSPKPLKCVMNLLTAATSLRFNPTSEILAIGSRSEDEATRLVSDTHSAVKKVFANVIVSDYYFFYLKLN